MPREQFERPFTDLPRLSHFGISDNIETYEFAPHYHYGYEIICVTRGSAEIELFQGRNPVFLQKDDLCIIPPGTIHEFKYDRQTISFYWMGFQTGDRVALSEGHMQPPPMLIQRRKEHKVEFIPFFDREIDEITEKIPGDDFTILRRVPSFIPLFSDINDELHCRDVFSARIVYQKILEIFTRIAREHSQEKRIHNPPVNYVRTYLDSHCLENVDFLKLSVKAGYTQEHLSRLFKTCFGQSPKKYHNEKRLDRACQFLAEGGSIENAARHCGFNSVSYFSTWFKKHKGITPQKY